jgi:hypothetical protein
MASNSRTSLQSAATHQSLRDQLDALRHMKGMTEVRLQCNKPFPRKYPAFGVMPAQSFTERSQMEETVAGLSADIEKILSHISGLNS